MIISIQAAPFAIHYVLCCLNVAYFIDILSQYSPVRDTTWLSANACHLAKCRS